MRDETPARQNPLRARWNEHRRPNRGDLVINGARPSMGKTALAVIIASRAASTAREQVLSMEMTLKELIDRVIAAPVVGPVLSITSSWLSNVVPYLEWLPPSTPMFAHTVHSCLIMAHNFLDVGLSAAMPLPTMATRRRPACSRFSDGSMCAAPVLCRVRVDSQAELETAGS